MRPDRPWHTVILDSPEKMHADAVRMAVDILCKRLRNAEVGAGYDA